jgi:hypothetical protein
MEFILLILLVALGLGAYLLYKKQQANGPDSGSGKATRPIDPLAGWDSSGGDKQFFELKPGDLLKYDQNDFFVRGTIRLEDGGYVWTEHLVDNASGLKRWLSVEDDDGLELGMWEKLPMADIESGQPGDRSVVSRGVAYKLVETGKATFTAKGTTSTAEAGSAEYMDYEAANGAMLGFERYDGGPWESALGTKVLPSEVTVYPSGA